MSRYFFGFLIFLLIVVAAYYFIGLPPSTIEESKVVAQPITIGFIGPLSGDLASYNAHIKNAIELALRDLKTQGKQVGVIFEDGKCNGEDARVALSKLVNDNQVHVVIGGICSGETLAMAPLAEEKLVVLLSPSASSPNITDAGTFTFRNIPSDASGGGVLGGFLAKKYNNLAIISENNEFSQNLRSVFLQKYQEEGGGQILIDEVFLPDAKDFKSIVKKIKEAEALAVLVIAQNESTAGALVKEIGLAKINLPLFSHLLPTGSKFLEVAGKAAEGIVFTDLPLLDLGNARVSTFLEDYKKNYGLLAGGQDFYTAAAYDAVNILTQAIERVGTDPIKVRDYLYSLSEYDGLIGKYSFDLNGDVVGVNLVLKKIKDGHIEDFKVEETANATTTAQ